MYCKKCETEKEKSEFFPTSPNKCRACHAKSRKESYKNDPQKYRDSKREVRKKLRHRIYQYLKLTGCIDCGETNPVVLEFDHIEDKSINISVAVSSCYSWKKMYEEMQKCEVRCANCHRIKTAKDFGWYSFLNEEPNTSV